GAAYRREWHGDRRAMDIRQPADLEQPGREHRPGVPGPGDCLRRSLTDGATRREHRARALLPGGIRRLLVHRDDVVGMDDLQALRKRLEPLAPAPQDGP